MAIRQHRVGFTDSGWALVQQEAKAQGISAAQFIREASLAYAIWLLARRGGNETADELERIIERLR